MSGHETFDLGPTVLQSGITLPAAHLAYRTYGRLNADRSNAILYPTSYGAQHSDVDWLVAPGRILDPERWFVVIPNQFGIDLIRDNPQIVFDGQLDNCNHLIRRVNRSRRVVWTVDDNCARLFRNRLTNHVDTGVE